MAVWLPATPGAFWGIVALPTTVGALLAHVAWRPADSEAPADHVLPEACTALARVLLATGLLMAQFLLTPVLRPDTQLWMRPFLWWAIGMAGLGAILAADRAVACSLQAIGYCLPAGVSTEEAGARRDSQALAAAHQPPSPSKTLPSETVTPAKPTAQQGSALRGAGSPAGRSGRPRPPLSPIRTPSTDVSPDDSLAQLTLDSLQAGPETPLGPEDTPAEEEEEDGLMSGTPVDGSFPRHGIPGERATPHPGMGTPVRPRPGPKAAGGTVVRSAAPPPPPTPAPGDGHTDPLSPFDLLAGEASQGEPTTPNTLTPSGGMAASPARRSKGRQRKAITQDTFKRPR
ncbi:hypothetical protein H696_00653 [Fonticula alba]|uniref:Uncharacterized protein n=1 Tax=Fonticula alba TaxID=691883 RepID=A0A058ZGP9_FONAL|nr:hypothetical protein H696_00653 [Fonticula alba]KCV73108.1 hypothetical protein H696_00653 [Fonticula alba]|eukprot:XP_009492809.1 hypothetical protein H696_00653 [Fonticula alba]